jgi:hypothetical protein
MLTLASLSLGNAAWVPSSQWRESRIIVPLASFFFGNHPWVSTLHCRGWRTMVILGGLLFAYPAWVPSFPLVQVADNSRPRRSLVRRPRVGSPFPLPRVADNGRPRQPLVRKPRVSSPSLLAEVADNGHPGRSLLSSCSSKASPPRAGPAAERFPLSAHFPPDISSTCLFLLGSLSNASLRQPTSAKQPLCIKRCVDHGC